MRGEPANRDCKAPGKIDLQEAGKAIIDTHRQNNIAYTQTEQ